MYIIETAFPRSGNTFLTFLLQKGLKGSEYIKIPKKFDSFQNFFSFIRNNIDNDKIYIFGHNHLSRNWELKIAGKFKLPVIFIFRSPFDCIASLLVVKHSKSRGALTKSEISNPLTVIRLIALYVKFVFWALFYRLFCHGFIVDFSELTRDTEKTLKNIGSFLKTDIPFDPEFVKEYMQSDFQKKADSKPLPKDDKKGNKIYLGVIQKMLIFMCCYPPYLLLHMIKK